MSAPESLIVREIDSADAAGKLSLGNAEFTPLKTFLRKRAKSFHRSNVAKTYVLVPMEGAARIWGYITLMCSQITLDGAHSLDDCESADQYKNLPAIKIVRIATDQEIQGQGYGAALVELAISISLEDIMPKVGCRFLIVDAKRFAVKFYEKIGFTILDTPKNRAAKQPLMFIDLHKLPSG